jgi:hypothetical protein
VERPLFCHEKKPKKTLEKIWYFERESLSLSIEINK